MTSELCKQNPLINIGERLEKKGRERGGKERIERSKGQFITLSDFSDSFFFFKTKPAIPPMTRLASFCWCIGTLQVDEEPAAAMVTKGSREEEEEEEGGVFLLLAGSIFLAKKERFLFFNFFLYFFYTFKIFEIFYF